MSAGKLLTCESNFLCLKEENKITPPSLVVSETSEDPVTCCRHLLVVVTRPLDLPQQVSQVCPDRDVVLPRSKLLVEMFVVPRILLQDHAVPRQQVRQPISCHSAINVYLVLVLMVHENNEKTHISIRISDVIKAFLWNIIHLTLKKSKNETCLTSGP